MAIAKEQKKYTFDDYEKWPEDERWELIDGAPYMLAPPSRKHQEISGELFRQLANYLQGKACKVYPAPFAVRIPDGCEKENKDIKNVFEPDISIICDKSKLDDKGCTGAPDLIIEIISPSSAKTDKVIKFLKYEQAGVKEYWIVEPDQKLLSVFKLENNRYGRPHMYTEEDTIEVTSFPDLKIDLSTIFLEE